MIYKNNKNNNIQRALPMLELIKIQIQYGCKSVPTGLVPAGWPVAWL